MLPHLGHDVLVRVCGSLRWDAAIRCVARTSRTWYNAVHLRSADTGPTGPFLKACDGTIQWRTGLLPGRNASADGWCAAEATSDAIRRVAFAMRFGPPGHVVMVGPAAGLREQLAVLEVVDGVRHLALRADGPDQAMPRLLEAVGRVPTLMSLSIELTDLTECELGPVLAGLGLFSLELQDCGLGQAAFDLQLANQTLRVLDLTHNPLAATLGNLELIRDTIPATVQRLYLGWVRENEPGTLEPLLGVIRRPRALTHLSLAGNGLCMEAGGATLLARTLLVQPGLVTLSLCANRLGRRPGEVTAVMRSIRRMSGLRHLYLNHNVVGDAVDAVGDMAGALRGKPLVVLQLNATLLAFRPRHLPQLSPALVTLTALRELHLRDNYIGRHRADLRALAAGLTGVETLNLGDNLIGRHLYIGEAMTLLSGLKRLTELDLSQNILGDEERAEPMHAPPRLQALSLLNNTIGTGPADAATVAALVDFLPRLTSLDISENSLRRPEDVRVIGNAVRHAPVLEELEVKENLFWGDPHSTAAFIRALGTSALLIPDSAGVSAALSAPLTSRPGLLSLLQDLGATQLVKVSDE